MTDHKDMIERLAWPVNPNAPEAEVTLPAWVLELCAEARQALESAQVERDTVWAEATAAAYGAAADIAHEGALATEDDGVAAWVRDRIKAQTPQSARDWLAEREAAIRADERANVAASKQTYAMALPGSDEEFAGVMFGMQRALDVIRNAALQLKEKDDE